MNVLDCPIDVFRIYVNETDYFMSKLPSLVITTKDTTLFDPKESYYQSIIGTWIATCFSGISIQHLSFNNLTPKQITSLLHFHLYFTVCRIVRELSVMNKQLINQFVKKYSADMLISHTPKYTW